LEEILKTIATNLGFQLLAAKVHYGDHVYVFVSACPKLCIPEIVRVLKFNSARLLFDEFAEISCSFGGHLWSEGYAVGTVGVLLVRK
jgi:REP element-mobilizing transposase RayT